MIICFESNYKSKYSIIIANDPQSKETQWSAPERGDEETRTRAAISSFPSFSIAHVSFISARLSYRKVVLHTSANIIRVNKTVLNKNQELYNGWQCSWKNVSVFVVFYCVYSRVNAFINMHYFGGIYTHSQDGFGLTATLRRNDRCSRPSMPTPLSLNSRGNLSCTQQIPFIRLLPRHVV